MNPDLEIERRNTPFNSYALSCFLFGGRDAYEKRLKIIKYVENVAEFENPKPLEFMEREERYENSLRKTISVIDHTPKLDIRDEKDSRFFIYLALNADLCPINLHHVMFLPALEGQCTDEQKRKWLPLAKSYSIIGTYAQTELGHGTNLKKLETVSVYDPETQEFVLHTPTLTATKWWPGNLGKSSNYAVVLAQLHTKGVNHGIHPFIVQLRDLKTHDPLPGVTVGDIGPKFGTPSNDNGFLRFNHVRIPRENMLMRFSRVEPDGTYVAPKHDKLIYGTMVHVRSTMIMVQAFALGRAVTIATRYSCVRRQGEMFEGQGEVKLLDYQTQQYRLFPELAKVYAFVFAGTALDELYNSIRGELQKGNVNQLPELHFVSAGLKAYTTYEISKAVEICRLSCGGHGYSEASGLPSMYTAVVGGCTYEGDNIVLFLQVARHLVKTVMRKTKEPLSMYLWKKPQARSALTESLDMEHVLDAYEHAARRIIFKTVQYLGELAQKGCSNEEAWQRCSVQLTKCSKAHVRVFVVKNFMNYVNKADDPGVKKIMNSMCQLYALYGIHVKSGAFSEDGYITQEQFGYIRKRIYDLLAEIRPMAIPLVDAFGYRDRELNSVLGRYDGNVYPNLFKWAQQSPLNKQDVLDCHHKYLKGLSQRSKI